MMPFAVLATVGRFAVLDQVVLGAYLLGMVLLGGYFSRREKSTDDYFRGGRRVPWWAAGLSIFGTALSSITYLAVPGNAFAGDWSMMIARFSPLLLIPLVAAVYIPFYRKLDVTTPYEYLQRRFSTPVRLLASAQWILLQFVRMSVIIYLPSLALNTVTGVDIRLCIGLIGVVTTVYATMGGIEAAVWTDVVQVVVLMGGAAVALGFVLAKVDGGFAGVITQGMQAGKFHTFQWTWSFAAPAVWVLVVGGAINEFSAYTTNQALVQRYMVTPDLRQARRALWTSALGGIPTGFLFFFLGTAMWVFYKQNPSLLPEAAAGDIARMKGDSVFPWFMVQQLPPGVSGLVIAGLFSAAMGAVCSGVNSISAALTTDFVRPLRRAAGERSMLNLARVLTLAAGATSTAIALAMAHWDIKSFYMFFMTVLGLFTGGVAGVFVLGIFSRRASAAGSLIGALAADALMVGMMVAWRDLPEDQKPMHGMLYGTVSLVVCLVVGYGASLLWPGQPKSLSGLTIFTRGHHEAPSPVAATPPPPSAAGAPARSPAGTRA
jgi:SSS family transporter